jgi:hypothetical protein
MGMVRCEEHGLRAGALFSARMHWRLNTNGPVVPGEIQLFEAEGLQFWSDIASLKDAGLPTDWSPSIEEFLETESFKVFPACRDCARHWLRENSIDPKDVGLE